MPVYQYVCGLGHTHEERRGYEVSSVPCASCGKPAQRESVYSVAAIGTEKKYRVSDVVEASQEMDYAHTRQEQQEGRKLKWRSPYKAGIREARRRI